LHVTCRIVLLVLSLALTPAAAVIPVTADGLISPAHYFDLQGKTLRFTPSRLGYVVATSKAKPIGALGTKLGRPDYPSIRSRGWWFSLPFEFPYGGRTWNQIYINSAGNLTFERPEAQLYSERDTWPAGTMQSVAGSLNDRAAAGEEKMICAFWGLNSPDADKSQIFVRRAATELVVTWQVQRYIWFGEAYQPLGPNVFQARLQPDGVIEFSYQQISEKDGIVGLFYGGADGVNLATAPGFSADQLGQTLRFTFQLANPVVTSVPEGKWWYRVFLDRGQHSCEIGLEVARKPRPYLLRECYGVPGFRIDGNRLELYISTFEADSSLGEGTRWMADVLSTEHDSIGEGILRVPRQGRASIARGYQEGNIFEVFHYPRVSKSVFPHLRYIYQRFPPQDDLAVVLTDFRIDDLHNHQGSTGAGYNVTIQGIGPRPAGLSGNTRLIGSSKLQTATGPVYLGPRFAETLDDGDYHYRNYANAVGWMAHELTHRWGMDLRFRNPLTGKAENLTGGTGHWSDYLNTPSMISVWPMFSNKPYSEKSQMEGFVWTQSPDSNFRRAPNPWNLPTGFSALDLYAMGLIGPDEVKETFLVAYPRYLSPNLFRGTKVPVRIEDVIAACGHRQPDVAESQKEFTIGIYLLHPGNRAVDPEKLRQAQGIEKALLEYFTAATGGRMHLIPTGSKIGNRP
jgi:hypothetical protein